MITKKYGAEPGDLCLARVFGKLNNHHIYFVLEIQDKLYGGMKAYCPKYKRNKILYKKCDKYILIRVVK